MMMNDARSSISLRKGLSSLLLIVTLGFIFLLLKGYSFGRVDHAYFIPSIYRMADPGYLRGDWYIDTLTFYHYIFKSIYVALLPLVPLTTSFFISYYLALCLYIFGIRKLSYALFNDARPFYFALPMIMVLRLSAIDATALIQDTTFSSMFLANALVICSLAFLFSNDLMRAYLVAGITTVVHVVIGIDLCIILGVYTFIAVVYTKKFTWRCAVLSLFWYSVLVAIPIAISLREAGGGDGASYGFSLIDYIRFRLPHHHILSSFRGSLVEFGLIGAMGIMAFKKSYVRRNVNDVMAIIGIIGAGVVGYALCIEGASFDFCVKFHFYRMSAFISLFACLFVGKYIEEIVRKYHGWVILPLAMACVFAQSPLIAWALLLILTIITQPKNEKFIAGLALAGTLVGWFGFRKIIPAEHMTSLLERLQFVPTTFFIIGVALITSSATYYLIKSRLKTAHYIIPIITLIVVMLSVQLKFGIFSNIHPGLEANDDWRKTCLWIDREMPTAARFIVPPYKEGFSLYAERSSLVDFKNGPWALADVAEWKKRLEALTGIDDLFAQPLKGWRFVPELKKRYSLLEEDAIIEVAREYACDYIIREKEDPLAFEIVHSSDSFIIYKIPK
jgi:hypothetical protein